MDYNRLQKMTEVYTGINITKSFFSGQAKEYHEIAELRKQLEEERRTVSQTSSEKTQLQCDIRTVQTEVKSIACRWMIAWLVNILMEFLQSWFF